MSSVDQLLHRDETQLVALKASSPHHDPNRISWNMHCPHPTAHTLHLSTSGKVFEAIVSEFATETATPMGLPWDIHEQCRVDLEAPCVASCMGCWDAGHVGDGLHPNAPMACTQPGPTPPFSIRECDEDRSRILYGCRSDGGASSHAPSPPHLHFDSPPTLRLPYPSPLLPFASPTFFVPSLHALPSCTCRLPLGMHGPHSYPFDVSCSLQGAAVARVKSALSTMSAILGWSFADMRVPACGCLASILTAVSSGLRLQLVMLPFWHAQPSQPASSLSPPFPLPCLSPGSHRPSPWSLRHPIAPSHCVINLHRATSPLMQPSCNPCVLMQPLCTHAALMQPLCTHPCTSWHHLVHPAHRYSSLHVPIYPCSSYILLLCTPCRHSIISPGAAWMEVLADPEVLSSP